MSRTGSRVRLRRHGLAVAPGSRERCTCRSATYQYAMISSAAAQWSSASAPKARLEDDEHEFVAVGGVWLELGLRLGLGLGVCE